MLRNQPSINLLIAFSKLLLICIDPEVWFILCYMFFRQFHYFILIWVANRGILLLGLHIISFQAGTQLNQSVYCSNLSFSTKASKSTIEKSLPAIKKTMWKLFMDCFTPQNIRIEFVFIDPLTAKVIRVKV
jgi:hypothetical protein